MATQWFMTFLPDGDGNKLRCEVTNTPLDTPPAVISLYVGDLVPLYRQSEIKNAWKWLYESVKSRNLLDGPYSGAVLYTGVDINDITSSNLRTSSVLADFNTSDIILAIGLDVTTRGDTNLLEAGFQQLIEFAAEETLKAA